MNKSYLSIISLILLACTSMTAWGAFPPPPVNQNLGIPDTMFNLLTKEVCWRCHKPAAAGELQPPAGVPVKTTYLPDRHHQHLNTPIAGGSEQPPFMDANGDGIEDTTYTCLNCHRMIPSQYGGFELEQTYRDCLFCHIVDSGDRTVHHDTPLAKEAMCGTCHGSLVRNLDAGMPPPSYSPSMITPWRSGKPNADTSITSSAGTHPGNCDFCHNTADGAVDGNNVPIGTPGVPSGFGSITVFTNGQNHHGTGVPTITGSSKGGACGWCHNMARPLEEGIRACQRCHDIPSLHNIEYDADGDGIVPGAEVAYNGHIGNNDNCWGCHGNDGQVGTLSMSMGSPSGATTPQLDDINIATWLSGTAFEMTLSGNGFINQGGPGNAMTFRPTVLLTDSAGSETMLTPDSESVGLVHVSIPDTLPAGNYWIQIKKGLSLSNPIVATITPAIDAGNAICIARFRIALLRGNNFGTHLDGINTGTSVTNGDGSISASNIYFWKNNMIAVRFPDGCPPTIKVTNVFDEATVAPSIW